MFTIIVINSVFRAGKNYYPLVFLKECKCDVGEKKIPKCIIDNTEISSDSDGEILMKKILVKKILKKEILTKKILMKKIK